jgi:mannitol/fructose-specific phosphotransferase system IIA component (Ntr-type)
VEWERDMIRFDEILLPEHILLNLPVQTREEAVNIVAKSLRGDDRIKDWASFYKTLSESERSAKCNLELGLTMPHTRTDAVTAMVMAFGRLATPLVIVSEEIRYVLIIGIPETMDADYLRLLGVLMRVFRDDELRAALDSATTAQAVLNVFGAGETELESE